MIDELDIRFGRVISLDRRKFFSWLKHLQGAPARTASKPSHRLPANHLTASDSAHFGHQLAALAAAVAAGHITEDEFQRAKAQLSCGL